AAHRSMTLPHPMVLIVASGVAAVILLGAVGFVGNHLIQNNMLSGAAKGTQGVKTAAADSTHEYSWAFDFDRDKAWKDADDKLGEAKEMKYRGRAKDSTQDAYAVRGESEELRTEARKLDGSKTLGGVVNGEVDALGRKNAGEGKPQSGGGGGPGRGFGGFAKGGGVEVGEKVDDKGGVARCGGNVGNKTTG